MVIEPPFDRRSAVAWSRSVLTSAETVFLDTETTGLGPSAEIVDIAVVAASGDVLFDALVRPSRRIPFEATQIHGIRDEDVAWAQTWQEVLAVLRPILSGRTIVVYNVGFDRTIVRQCCERIGMVFPQATWHCAMKAYAAYRQEQARGRSGYRWHSLPAAAGAFGLPAGGHRALADAEVCRRVVLAMADWGQESGS
jgi:DNA polymerase III epsilon subunit-like protein